VDAADEVVSLDVPVTEENATMQTAAVQDRYFVVVPDDDEVDVFGACVCRFTVGKVAPGGDRRDRPNRRSLRFRDVRPLNSLEGVGRSRRSPVLFRARSCRIRSIILSLIRRGLLRE